MCIGEREGKRAVFPSRVEIAVCAHHVPRPGTNPECRCLDRQMRQHDLQGSQLRSPSPREPRGAVIPVKVIILPPVPRIPVSATLYMGDQMVQPPYKDRQHGWVGVCVQPTEACRTASGRTVTSLCDGDETGRESSVRAHGSDDQGSERAWSPSEPGPHWDQLAGFAPRVWPRAFRVARVSGELRRQPGKPCRATPELPITADEMSPARAAH